MFSHSTAKDTVYLQFTSFLHIRDTFQLIENSFKISKKYQDCLHDTSTKFAYEKQSYQGRQSHDHRIKVYFYIIFK
jgi:hypothetical protein